MKDINLVSTGKKVTFIPKVSLGARLPVTSQPVPQKAFVVKENDLQNDPFETLFLETVSIIDGYLDLGDDPGEYLRHHHTDVYLETNRLEDAFNEIWKSGRLEKLEEFKRLLDQWRNLWIKGIELQKKGETQNEQAH